MSGGSGGVGTRALGATLEGVRALLLDLDGVIVLKGEVIAGATAALARLDEAGLPFLVLTNTSLFSRESLSRRLAGAGIDLPPTRIMTAASATADYTARTWPGRPLYVLAAPDALREFDGQRLLSHEDAAAAALRSATDAVAPPVAAVAVGDAAEEFTPGHVGTAFRLVRGGARLVAMHRNRWWLTPEGETIDAGAYVAGLEYATERRAFLVGKPSPAFFRSALRGLRALAAARGQPRPATGTIAMVGDDLRQDLRPARRLGLRTALVLTGRHRRDDLARAAAARDPLVPDAVAASLAAFVAALD